MKSIFIAFDQANLQNVQAALSRSNVKGYTMVEQAQGSGSNGGEPHFGSHAWPGMNSAILTVVPDETVAPLLERLKQIDNDNPLLGLRAFVWNIEQSI